MGTERTLSRATETTTADALRNGLKELQKGRPFDQERSGE